MATEAPELTVSVERPASWSRRLTITVPAKRVADEKRQATARLAQRVRLPGFRKGHVPAGVMEKRFGAAIEQDTLQKLIDTAYREALASEGLQPITEASVENIEYQPGTDLTFRVELEVRPEIELARIGGFTVVREHVPVGDAQIDEIVQRLREENAVWQPKEGETATAGDMATVEITPLDDATSATPGRARQYQIVIGEGQAVPAIEDAIRTLRPGEAADFDVELPADDESGALRAHRMHIHVIEIKAPQLPELDDEFARGLGDFEDLPSLRARIREDLEREAEREAERGVRMQLMQQIVDANAFEVPPSMVRRYVDRVLPAREGVDEERLDAMRSEVQPAAEFALKRMLVIDRIAEMEGLHARPEDVDARIDAIAARAGRSRGDVIKQLKKSGQFDELEQELTEDRVFEYLKSLSDAR